MRKGERGMVTRDKVERGGRRGGQMGGGGEGGRGSGLEVGGGGGRRDREGERLDKQGWR